MRYIGCVVYGKWECNKHCCFKNPHEIFGVPLHDCIVGVWCAVRALKIVGLLFFFKEILNSYRYCRFNVKPFFRELRTEKSTVLHIGKNHSPRSKFISGCPSRSIRRTVDILRLVASLITRSESVYYLWETLTSRVYVFNTNSVHEMKYHITGRMVNIPEKSCFLCRRLYFQSHDAGYRHFKTVLWK